MATVYLCPGPFGIGGQFFTTAGLPLNAGLIYTYSAGTTTPLATYTTSAGSVQNANPIVLDADGRVPGEIWLTSVAYRFDLKDSLGNLIKTYDNIPGGLIPASDLAASTGSGLVGTIASGTGAVARTAQAKFREIVSTDDYTTVQEAFNQFTNVTGGGDVFVSPGTHLLTSSLILDVSGMRVWGVPGMSILKRANNVAADTMNVLQTSYQGRYANAPISDVLLDGITLDGNKANNTIGVNDNFDHCMNALYAVRLTVRNCVAKNALRLGLAASTGADNYTVFDCRVYSCDEGGIYAEVSANAVCIGNYLESCSTASFNIGAISFNKITGGTISANVVNGGEDGIYIRNECSGVTITGNTIRSVVRNSIWVYDEGQGVGGHTPVHTNITGNMVVGATGPAILLQYANDTVVFGNNLDTSYQYGIKFNNCALLKIGGNVVTGATVASILDNAGNSLLTIHDVEGTWTPILQGASTAGAGTYSVQTGRYQYNGKRIEFSAVVTWSAHTGTGQMQYTVPLAISASDASIFTIVAYNLAYTGGIAAISVGGQSYARIHQNSGGTLTNYAIQASGTIYLSGSYEFNGS